MKLMARHEATAPSAVIRLVEVIVLVATHVPSALAVVAENVAWVGPLRFLRHLALIAAAGHLWVCHRLFVVADFA